MAQRRRVVVIGAGNAALCAALAASDQGAEVIVLERTSREQRGGNSFFSGGWMRFAFASADEVAEVAPELAVDGSETFDVVPYTEADYFDELVAITEYRTDPDLAMVMIKQSRATIGWLHSKGLRFTWTFGKQIPKRGDRPQVSAGNIMVTGGGPGIVENLSLAAERAGVEFRYETRAVGLLGVEGVCVTGVRVEDASGARYDLEADAVIMASGGYSANVEKRARYLGPGWDLAKVRGSAYNTGDVIDIALGFGAQPFGHWSGAHAVCWDATSPLSGDRVGGNEFARNSYPLGILVNRNSRRFLDEAADFSSNTYGRYGSELVKQPGGLAFQIFDSQMIDHLDPNYSGKLVSKEVADTIEELAVRLDLDPGALRGTVDAFNEAVDDSVEFKLNERDGKATIGLAPPKSNWAMRLEKPPFYGFTVTTGLTFTFGGVRVDKNARVISTTDKPITGLFAAGEMLGGIFYYFSPSGGGLMAGSVFGRIAGQRAASVDSL